MTTSVTQQYAVIADIHSNAAALREVLADVRRRGIHRIINLGDSVYGPLEPVQTLELLHEAGAESLSGNEDRLYGLTDAALAAQPTAQWVLGQLSAAQVHSLRMLPATLRLGDTVLACHGTPTSDETYLLETVTEHGARLSRPEEIQARLDVEAEVVLCAHSHVPRTVWLDGCLIVNPGSVGLPAYVDRLPFSHRMETGSPHARYAVVSQRRAEWQVEQIALPYAWQESAALARRNGRPDWARWLATGRS